MSHDVALERSESEAIEPRSTPKRELWRTFVSYRQSDGKPVADRLYRSLHDSEIEFDDRRRKADLKVYWDKRAPGVSNYQRVLSPWLRSSRALIFVVTNDGFERRPGTDHLHAELEWWAKNRRVAPILIDVHGLGLSKVPTVVRSRWGKAQVIDATEAFDPNVTAQLREQRWRGVLIQIRDGIRISETGIRFQELEHARAQNRRLLASLIVVVTLGIAIWIQKGRIARALEESEQRRVVADIAACDLQIKQRDFQSARERLESIPQHRRDFEWGQLKLHVDPSRVVFAVKPDSPAAMDLSAAGDVALIGDASGRVGLWNPEVGALKREFGSHGMRISAVAFANDERVALTADRSGKVRAWRLSDGSFREYDLHDAPISNLEVGPDGKLFLTCDDSGQIRLSTIEDLEIRSSEIPVAVTGDLATIGSNGEAIAAVAPDGSVSVQDLSTHAVTVMPKPVPEPAAIVMSAAAKRIAVADLRGSIWLFDVARRRLIEGLHPFDAMDGGSHIQALELSSDGTWLYAGCSDGAVRIWDLTTRVPVGTFPGFSTSVAEVAIAAEPTRFLACDDYESARFFDLDPFRLAAGFYELPAELKSFASDPAGEVVVVSTEDGTLLRFNGSNLEPESSVMPALGRFSALRFDREGTRLAAVSSRGELAVLDAKSLETLRDFSPTEEQIACAIPMPGSEDILVGTTRGMIEQNNAVYRWSDATSELRDPLLAGLPPVQALEIAPDGRVAAVGTVGSIGLDEADRIPARVAVFEASTGRVLWDSDVEGSVESLRFLPKRGWLAIGNSNGRIELRDVDDGEVVRTLKGHTEGVRAIDVNESESRLVTASVDGTARLWDLELGAELLVLHRQASVMVGVCFAHKDRRVLVGNGTRVLGFWNSDPWR